MPVCKMGYVRIGLLWVYSFLVASMGYGQNAISKVVFHYPQSEEKVQIIKNSTPLKLTGYLNKKLEELRYEGYWTARIADSLYIDDTNLVMIETGGKMAAASVSVESLPEGWKSAIERQLNLENVLLDELSTAQIANEIIEYAQNHGYPFANVWFELDETDESALKVKIDKGPEFRILEVQFDEEIRITTAFLMNYLGLKKGELFNYDNVRDIPQKLSGLSYLRLTDDPRLSFSDIGNVRIWLSLENQKVSNIDGIIGVAPGSSSTGGTLITGELDFNLRNPFSRGTSLDFSFEKFQASSQRIDLAFAYPYMFSSALGTDFNFNLERLDTLYANLNTRLGFSYYLSGNSRIMAFFTRQNSYPIGSGGDISGIYKNVNISHYGLLLEYRRLDYVPNPSKGLEVVLEGSAGRKLELQDEIELTNTVYRATIDLSYHLRLSRLFSLVYLNQTIFNIDSTFSNGQVKWIGGLSTLRGFNEGAIPAKDHMIQSIEMRLLTDRNSHAKLFYDLGFVSQVNQNGAVRSRTYSGAGIGYSFKTGPGLFAINYAVALSQESGIAFSDGKVHFGFISYF